MTTRRSRPASALLLVVSLVAGLAVALSASPASAAVAVATPNPAEVPGAPDYATERFADPWDYENPEDQRLDSKAGMLNVTNQRFDNGRLQFTAQANSSFDPVLTWPGDIPWGRDGELHPIDSGRYDRVSFSMFSSSAANAGVFWFNCPTRTATCQGAARVALKTGWNVYNVELQNEIGAIDWAGPITSFRIIPNVPAGTTMEFAWMRLHKAEPPVNITWTDDSPGNEVSLYWDRDDNLANNTVDSPDWGLVETKKSAGSNTSAFQASAFPPGQYRFFADDDGTPSPYSDPLTINARPQPVIMQPDAAGGTDYASAVRGDAWDFDQASDAAGVPNSQGVTFANSAVNATNGPPIQNDPQVLLPLGPAPIDASRFHRLSFSYSYAGAFGLEDAPGGGTMSRIIWEVLNGGPNNYQDLNDIVTYQGPNNVVVDLATLPMTQLLDEDQKGARIGYMGQQITSLRFDPNEDPGTRSWSLGDIRLAEDDAAGPEGFDITFRDDAWEQGTTAEIFVDTDAAGFDGTKVGDMPVTSGTNTFRWVPQVGGGRYYPYIVLNDGTTENAATYASGPVSVRTVGRLAGADRIATSIAVADNTFAPGSAQVGVLARHDNFPDALAGTPLAAEKGGPLMLTQPNGLDSRVADALKRIVPQGNTVYLLGGAGALSPAVEEAVRALGYTPMRLSGADRYETAVAIASAVGTPTDILVTTGTNFPDALAAGAAAGALEGTGVVVLSNGESLPPSTAGYINTNSTARRFAVGGQAAAADPGGTRLAGANRYETSQLVAEKFFPAPTFVGIASGVNFPDALGGGVHAARRGSPLLLSPPAGLPGPVAAYLQARRDAITAGVLYGGPAALSENVRIGVEQAIG